MKIENIAVDLLDFCGNDLSVCNAARVSFDKVSTELTDKDSKLIKYLAKHKHKSPFNHAFMSFRVKAPLFCARQMVKHEYLPFNEVSRRYVTTEPSFYFPEYWRKAADNVKQGSSDEPAQTSTYLTEQAVKVALLEYNRLLSDGVCAEQARMILPQSMMTTWTWSGTLFAFAKMCKLRLDSHTQKETREVAQKVAERAEHLFPVSWKALMEYGE